MTKQNAEVTKAVSATIATPSIVSNLYPPPRVGGVSRRRILAPLDFDLAAEKRNNSWVEAMKASSPTVANAAAIEAADPSLKAQDAWTTLNPSALLKFDEIVAASRGKQIIMFLDYDGTLSPIVDDPDSAFMSDSMRATVRDVARHFPTAIVSGRCRDKVYKFVRLAELYYAGSHGMDIKGPKQKKTKVGHLFHKRLTQLPIHDSIFLIHNFVVWAKSILFQPASEFLPMIQAVYKQLVLTTESVYGAKVENNKFCLSVHYRRVDEKRWSALANKVKLVVKQYPKLKLTQGRKVLEIRPTIKWGKGKALEFLLESLGFSESSDVLPVYIGDDRTDEDAFKVLCDRGQGFGILVSKIPKDTHAAYSLQAPVEVMDFLNRLVDWKRSL